MSDFFDLVRRQRACRSFSDDAVDDAVVERLLAAATFAPSAENSQPWIFVVVRDAGRRAALGALMAKAWRSARAYSRARLDDRLFAEVDAGLGSGAIAAAPVLIVVGVDLDLVHPNSVGSSAFPAVQNLLLAATQLGLGSALTTIATTHGAELRTVLEQPPMFEPVAVIPIGHPTRPLGPARRTPPRVVHR
jgi:nitroreductase